LIETLSDAALSDWKLIIPLFIRYIYIYVDFLLFN
jgi:hypothetical protein